MLGQASIQVLSAVTGGWGRVRMESGCQEHPSSCEGELGILRTWADTQSLRPVTHGKAAVQRVTSRRTSMCVKETVLCPHL